MRSTVTAIALALLLAGCTQVVPAAPADPMPTLAGTSWQLTGLLDGSTVDDPVDGAPVTVQFDESSLSGKACNSFRASYTLDGNTIAIGQAAATRMACTEAGVMEQENRVLGLLTSLTSVRQDAGELVLTAPDGRGLRFGRA